MEIFKCPSCQGNLDWQKYVCRYCGKGFTIQNDILNFLSVKDMTEQQETQVNIHQQLAFNKSAASSREFEKIYTKYWNQQYLSHLSPYQQRILDVGCGTGDLTRELSENASLTVGMDISMDMLKNAKMLTKTNKGIIWTGCVGEKMPFSDEIFDVVCFRGSLHHMANEKSALKEAFRVLKTNGTMIISEPNDDSLLLRIPRKIVTRKMKRFSGDHKAFLSKKWIETIKSIGFTIVFTKYFSYLSQPLCGMSDIMPLLSFLPFSKNIAKFLVAFDELCSKIPVIKQQSFDYIIVCRK